MVSLLLLAAACSGGALGTGSDSGSDGPVDPIVGRSCGPSSFCPCGYFCPRGTCEVSDFHPACGDAAVADGPATDGPVDPIVGRSCGAGAYCPCGYFCPMGKCEVADFHPPCGDGGI